MVLDYTIVSSTNIFLDSRNGIYHDECDIDLTLKPINAAKNEYIQLTLNYFDMTNNLYNVNFRNCMFDVSFTYNSILDGGNLKLTNENYYNLHEIASNFAVKLGLLFESKTNRKFRVKEIKNTILSQWTVFNVDGGLDATPGRPVGDGNQLLDITLEAYNAGGNVIAHGITGLHLSFPEDSELYLILGGLKTNNGNSCMLVDTQTNYITVRGFFPMRRSSDNHTFMRCDLNGNNFSTPINDGVSSKEFSRSNILALFKNDVEYISYINNNDLFNITLEQKSISKFKIWLTDYKGRKLIKTENEGTSSGLQDNAGNFYSNKQNTQGNLYFTASLNIKVIKIK